MAELLNVATAPTNEPPLLDVSTSPISTVYNGAQAEETANRYDYGLGKDSPGMDVIANALLSGQENSLRQRQSLVSAMKERSARQQALQQYLATKHTGKVDNATLEYAKSVIMDETIPPETVMEREMGKTLVSEVTEAGGLGLTKELEEEGLPKAEASVRGASKLAQFAEIGQRIEKEFEKKRQGLGWGTTASNIGEMLVPFLSSYRMTNAVPGTDESPLFLGTNMEAQRKELWLSGTPEEFERKLRDAYEPMFASNHFDAAQWLNYMLHPDATTKLFLDALNPIDIAIGVTPLDLLRVGKGTARLAKGTADVVKAARIPGFSRLRVKDAAGKADAALDLAVKNLQDEVSKSGVRPQSFAEIEGSIDPLINPETVVGGSYAFLGREKARRLLIEMKERAANLINASVLDPVKIDRLSDARALTGAMTSAEESFNLSLPQLSNRALFVRHATGPEDTAQGVHVMEIGVGDIQAGLYNTSEEALTDMRAMGLIGASVKTQGGKYYLSLKKVLPETEDIVRAGIATATDAKVPVTSVNMYTSLIRSQDGLIDRQTMKDMKTAQFGAGTLLELMKKEAAALPALRKESRKKLSDFLQSERVAPALDKAGTVGRTSTTLGEFESNWLAKHGSIPSDAETSAYFAFVQINNNDLLLRNLGLLRDKNRMGLENFNFKYKTADATYTAKDLEGKILSRLPWDASEDTGIVVLNTDLSPITITTKTGKTQTGNYFRLKRTAPEAFEKETGSGKYKIIQLSRLGAEQLRNLPGMDKFLPEGQIGFLLLKDATPAQLKFWQIPHRSGFHIQYPMSGSRVVQPNVAVRGTVDPHSTYYGDKTLFFQSLHEDAVTVANRVDTARIMYNDVVKGTVPEKNLDDYIRSNLPGYNLKRFKALFVGKAAVFSPDLPFLPTRMGQTSFDAHKLSDKFDKLVKSSDSEFNLYKGFDLEYTMERDMPLNTFTNKGTTADPIYKFEPAPMMDPIPTIEAAIGGAMRGRYLDDLKIKGAEKFIQQFSQVLETPLAEMRRDPIRYLLNPVWKRNVNEAERPTLAAAKNYQKAHSNFLAVKNELDKAVDYTRYRLLQGIFKGEEPNNVEKWFISKMTDPASFFRQIAFDTKLGLFNPIQFFKQLNTLVHTAGVAGPVQAANGATGALYMRALFANPRPELVADAAKRMTKWGWKEAEFTEAFEALNRSGFWHVGREISQLDNYTSANMFQGPMGTFFHWGRTPFRVGDQFTRLTAFNVAYKEWRVANKTVKLTDNVVRDLISRADDLTVNMSAASNSLMQRGYAGVFTQFMGYQMRMTEQFIGKKLTGPEKRRLFGTYAAMYGVPVAGAGTIGVWPLNETFNEWRLENPEWDETIDNNVLLNATAQGIPGAIIEAITGEAYNIGEAHGPGGIQILEDIIDGDRESADFMAGVSGSVLHDMFFATEPFTMMLMDTIRGDSEMYAPSAQDIIDFLKPISTANSVDKIYHAIAWGEYITKGGTPVDDVSEFEGVMMGLLGVSPQRIVDTYLKMDNTKDKKDFQDRMKKEAIKHYRQGFRLHSQLDTEAGLNEFRKATMFLTSARFTPKERVAVVVEASKGYKNLMLDVGKAYAEGDPAKKKAFINELRRKGVR